MVAGLITFLNFYLLLNRNWEFEWYMNNRRSNFSALIVEILFSTSFVSSSILSIAPGLTADVIGDLPQFQFV